MEKVFQKAQNVKLRPEEKEQIREHLVRFMAQHPLGQPVPFWRRLHVVGFKPALSFAVLAMLVFGGGTGMAFAAHGTLPGDFLYPVKTQVNEKILGFMQFSEEAKVQYDLGLVAARLEEIEKVSTRQELDAGAGEQAQALLDSHINQVKNRVQKMKETKGLGPALTVQSHLEASLEAHANVMEKLSAAANERGSQTEKKVTMEVKKKVQEVKKIRQQDELALSARPAVDVRAAAEGKLKSIQYQFDAATAFVDAKASNLSAGTLQKAREDLASANDMIANGQTRLEAADYNGAFIMFSSASRMLAEIRIYVAGEIQLQVKLDVLEAKLRAQQQVDDVQDKIDEVKGNINDILR